MPGCTCTHDHCHTSAATSPRYRRVLWIALLINALMFGVEILGGLHTGSVSLLADAIDFAGDAGNYAISLAVLGMGLAWRSRAAMFKGACMSTFGLVVLGRAIMAFASDTPPEPMTMGLIATLALLANVATAIMLFAYREGDANMRSVWLCSRNDAIGNVAVMLAAVGVFGTGRGWPDLAVAILMAGLALSAGVTVMRQAHQEHAPA